MQAFDGIIRVTLTMRQASTLTQILDQLKEEDTCSSCYLIADGWIRDGKIPKHDQPCNLTRCTVHDIEFDPQGHHTSSVNPKMKDGSDLGLLKFYFLIDKSVYDVTQ